MLKWVRRTTVCSLTVAALVTGVIWLVPGPNKGNRGATLIGCSPGFNLQLVWDNEVWGIGSDAPPIKWILGTYLYQRRRFVDKLSITFGWVVDKCLPDRTLFRFGSFYASTYCIPGDEADLAEWFINYHTQFTFPFWFLFGALAAYPGVVFVQGPLRRWRRRRRGFCVKCGYNLKALTEARCPECGTAFALPPGRPDHPLQ